jgi:hypothetical protein
MHESVELPVPPLMDDWLSEHVRLVEFELTERVTVPVKPLMGERFMVEEPEAPALTVTETGLDAIAKSWTMYSTVAVRDRLPLVPVTIMWFVNVDEKVHDRVALPDPVTLVGTVVHDVLFVVRLTTPENPF